MELGRKRRQRQPDAGLDAAHLGQRPLDRDRIGLDEQVQVQGQQRRLIASAAGQSPASAALHIRAIGPGATLAVTEITPCPPIAISASAESSLPL